MKLEYSLQIFKKCLSTKFIKFVKWEACISTQTEGRTDRHDEANILCSQFCEFAYYAVVCSHVPVSVIYMAHIIGHCTERFASRQGNSPFAAFGCKVTFQCVTRKYVRNHPVNWDRGSWVNYVRVASRP
jgi:hypothetical protein